MSQSIANVAAALAQFQGIVTNPKKDSVNPHFRSKYADLDSIITTIRPALEKCGLAFLQNPVTDENGNIGVYTIILHKSGEFIQFDPVYIPTNRSNPHQVGAALTYARRYSLGAALGIATEEDDDGNSIQENGPAGKQLQQRQGKPAEKKAPVTAVRKAEAAQITNELQAQDRSQYINGMKEAANNLNAMAHDPEKSKKDAAEREKEGRKRLAILAKEKGLTDEERKAIIKAETGKDSTTDLKLSQLIEMYQFFKKHTPEQLKEIAKAHLIRMKASQQPNTSPITDEEIEKLLGSGRGAA